MRKKLYVLALLAGWIFAGSKVSSAEEAVTAGEDEDAPASVSVSDIEALNNRVSALEKTNVKVGALVQFWYTHDSWGTNTTGTPSGSSGDYNSSKNQWDAFSFKRGEVSVGSDIGSNPKVTWLVKIDPTQASFTGLGLTAGAPLTYTGSAVGAASLGNINPFTVVKDLYVKVAYSPYATVILGQNKFAQELEGRWASNDGDFNNLSSLANAFGNKRDIGVQVTGTGIPFGDLPVQAEYTLSVIQGSGQSTADNNSDKDFAGRIGFTYDKNLFLGASAYDGWEVNGARWDVGLEARWLYQGFKLQGEFAYGNVNTLDNSSGNNSSWTAFTSLPPLPAAVKGFAFPVGQINPAAYYLTASYRYQDWRLGARWDGYNFNQWKGSAFDQEFDTLTVGFDWYQDKDTLKLSLNWEDRLLDGVEAYQVTTLQSQLSI